MMNFSKFALSKKYAKFKHSTFNARDTNYFTKIFTNCWCSEWLLVNEKVILIIGLDENQ